MTMDEAVETSIQAAIRAGRISETDHAAPIQALRELAKRAMVASEKDNVTYPTMLKYMDSLGLLPDEVVKATASDGRSSSMSRMRGKLGGMA